MNEIKEILDLLFNIYIFIHIRPVDIHRFLYKHVNKAWIDVDTSMTTCYTHHIIREALIRPTDQALVFVFVHITSI